MSELLPRNTECGIAFTRHALPAGLCCLHFTLQGEGIGLSSLGFTPHSCSSEDKSLIMIVSLQHTCLTLFDAIVCLSFLVFAFLSLFLDFRRVVKMNGHSGRQSSKLISASWLNIISKGISFSTWHLALSSL